MGPRTFLKRKVFGKKDGKATTTEAVIASPGQAAPSNSVAASSKITNDILDKTPDDSAFGLDVWVDGIDPTVDIVAIHGLNGHREKTWTAKNNVNWLRDANMLSAIIPNARIMSWGYDANTQSTKVLSAMYLYDHAQSLVSDLNLFRRNDHTHERPIIFVAHSLGGIVLKSALIHSDSARYNHLYELKSVKTSTYGIIFMGTPHQGGEGIKWGKRLVNVASIFVKTNDKLLNILEKESELLHQQLGQYNSISGDFHTKFAYETKPTPLALGAAMVVVPKSSAVVPSQVDAESIAIMGDHNSMVKFAKQSNEFKKIAGHLKLMTDKAPSKVQENWRAERIMELARGGNRNSTFEVDFDLSGVPTTSHFIGRSSDLKLIEMQLRPGSVQDRRIICVVHGLGGIGKTQLAVEYARRHKSIYSSFFWINGKTEESLLQSFLLIASRLPTKGPKPDIETQKITNLDESRRVAQETLKWFTLKGNTQWLLVFDNVDKTSYEEDSDHPEESSYNIAEYFPRSDTGSIIITTRLERLTSLGSSIALGKVSVVDGLSILESHARRRLRCSGKEVISKDAQEVESWDPDAVALVKRLGCLPLALVFAGSYISKTTVVKYLELYKESWDELHKKMKQRDDYPERTIITTWQISFDEVEHRDPKAAKLLQLWGYLDNQEIWYELLKWSGWEKHAPDWLHQVTATEINFLATIDTLSNFSLVEKNENNNTYSMHAVVHDWIQQSVNKRKDSGLLETAMTTIGLLVPDDNTKDAVTLVPRLLPHHNQLLRYLSHVTESPKYVDINTYLYSLQRIGALSSDYGRLREAEQIYRRALQSSTILLGAEHIRTLEICWLLGSLRFNLGDMTEAEKMYQRALQVYEKIGDPGHLSKTGISNNLALLYERQGKLVEAEKMFLKVLQEKEEVLGVAHMSTISTVHNLGNLYRKQDRFVEAKELIQRALQGEEQELGPMHPVTLGTVHNLGCLYQDQGDLTDAEEIFQRALYGMKKALGPEHLSTLNIFTDLGQVYFQQGKLPEAEDIFHEVLRVYEKVLDVNGIVTYIPALRASWNLGCLFDSQNDFSRARMMYTKALEGYEKVLGVDHPNCRTLRDNISGVDAQIREEGHS